MTGRLIVIDGVDGCGKGTQIELLKKEFGSTGDFLFTREPGGEGSEYAEKIRSLILSDRNEPVSPMSDFLMFWSARDVHIRNVIIPAIKAGKTVVSDRLDSSTFAFQIYGEKNLYLESLFQDLRTRILSRINPLYIFLDLPPEVSLERIEKDENRKKTHFDKKPIEYHERVHEGFFRFTAMSGVNASPIDANQSKEKVYELVREFFV